MNNEKIYLTFPTDRRTAYLLKEMAKGFKMTQPELINIICKDFIRYIDDAAKQDPEVKKALRK